MSHHTLSRRRSVPDLIRRYSPLIALFWLGLAVLTNVFVPQLETVAEAHNVSLSPQDAPSLQAAKQIGKVFQEFDSDSSAMILLEGDKPLGPEAHRYYDEIVKRLEQDKKHVQHIQDFWSDPLTAAGSQSPQARTRDTTSVPVNAARRPTSGRKPRPMRAMKLPASAAGMTAKRRMSLADVRIILTCTSSGALMVEAALVGNTRSCRHVHS